MNTPQRQFRLTRLVQSRCYDDLARIPQPDLVDARSRGRKPAGCPAPIVAAERNTGLGTPRLTIAFRRAAFVRGRPTILRKLQFSPVCLPGTEFLAPETGGEIGPDTLRQTRCDDSQVEKGPATGPYST
jgi:hypothetical protein